MTSSEQAAYLHSLHFAGVSDERANNTSFGKTGQFPAGDDSREQILPTRDSPSVVLRVPAKSMILWEEEERRSERAFGFSRKRVM